MTTHSTSVPKHWVFIQPIQITDECFSDQTGRFPITSIRGYKYIMLVYNFDSNETLSEPIKPHTEIELF